MKIIIIYFFHVIEGLIVSISMVTHIRKHVKFAALLFICSYPTISQGQSDTEVTIRGLALNQGAVTITTPYPYMEIFLDDSLSAITDSTSHVTFVAEQGAHAVRITGETPDDNNTLSWQGQIFVQQGQTFSLALENSDFQRTPTPQFIGEQILEERDTFIQQYLAIFHAFPEIKVYNAIGNFFGHGQFITSCQQFDNLTEFQAHGSIFVRSNEIYELINRYHGDSTNRLIEQLLVQVDHAVLRYINSLIETDTLPEDVSWPVSRFSLPPYARGSYDRRINLYDIYSAPETSREANQWAIIADQMNLGPLWGRPSVHRLNQDFEDACSAAHRLILELDTLQSR